MTGLGFRGLGTLKKKNKRWVGLITSAHLLLKKNSSNVHDDIINAIAIVKK
jgi:hypothetical protein